ncbi:Oleoyl-(acyl-carrier-protein) hydrolase [Rippkaea orientalis PCC 8801]|uniref:Oleoyl-(Acyl-carrier-protein) hydrolase n=1 Tax=Rippkaea orientalis (strain PCC 8801 / RF-1) TaxID=41431 RepID=B7JWF7_RIPO1|nr:thioesterase domain-containing protein [Rippkaea orientalis]ACK67002.1 Oleoyl-(acyl-carrier-protein) hydrolase [Rippkaea orientalis PCC 8801]
MKSPTNPWIYCPQPNPSAKLRLFCFPYAGTGARIFRNWPNQLPKMIEVCAIKLPGREARINEKPITKLTTLVEIMTPYLLPYSDKPFAFFGHSMGSLVSFEVAHQLLKLYGLSPIYLFISGYRAPQIPDPDPPIHALPESLFIEAIHNLNGTPPSVLQDDELMQLLIPILRADFSILETYIYDKKTLLNCPIIAFGGLNDPEANQQELQAWEQQTSQSFSLKMLQGDHFFIHSEESAILNEIAKYLSQCTK